MSVQTTYGNVLDIGFAGMLADSADHDVLSMVNNEASAELAFGQAVVFEGSTDDQGALSPDNLADVVAGLLLHSHAYSNAPDGDLGAAGVKAGGTLNVLRKGRVLVTCEDGCSPGDRLHIAIGTGADAEGTLRASADGVNTIDSTTQGVWMTTATAGNLAVLEVDFTNEP